MTAHLFEPNLPEPALSVTVLFYLASSTQRTQKATGSRRAKTHLEFPHGNPAGEERWQVNPIFPVGTGETYGVLSHSCEKLDSGNG